MMVGAILDEVSLLHSILYFVGNLAFLTLMNCSVIMLSTHPRKLSCWSVYIQLGIGTYYLFGDSI